MATRKRSRDTIDNPDYNFYVVSSKLRKIVSGWEYPDDARDDAKEWAGLGVTVKVVARRSLVSVDRDPKQNEHWVAGDQWWREAR